jgi:hypothetical protein
MAGDGGEQNLKVLFLVLHCQDSTRKKPTTLTKYKSGRWVYLPYLTSTIQNVVSKIEKKNRGGKPTFLTAVG